MVVVLRAKVMSRADISGVITPTRSSGADHPIERVDQRLADVVRAADVDVVGVEEQHEHARARVLEPSTATRRTVFGSMRVSCGPAARTTTRSNCSIVCGTPLSRTSKSSCGGRRPARRLASGRRRRGRSWLRCGRWAAAAVGLAAGLARAGDRDRRTPRPRSQAAGDDVTSEAACSPQHPAEPFISAPIAGVRVYTGPSASSACDPLPDRARSARRDRRAPARPSRSARRPGC